MYLVHMQSYDGRVLLNDLAAIFSEEKAAAAEVNKLNEWLAKANFWHSDDIEFWPYFYTITKIWREEI